MTCGTRDGYSESYRSGANGWTSSASRTPMTERRRMDVADFRRLGYLQEVNRLLLHRRSGARIATPPVHLTS
jgi:hypothetical protein